MTGAQSVKDCFEEAACEAGMYMNETLWLQEGLRSIACQNCFPGYYKAAKGDEACKECVRGRFTQIEKLTQDCGECAPGKYNDAPAQITCRLCPNNTFLNRNGGTSMEECSDCMQNAITTTTGEKNAQNCICAKQFYLLPCGNQVVEYTHWDQGNQDCKRMSNATHHFPGECHQCPNLGVDCDHVGSTLKQLKMTKGFWRARLTSRIIEKCITEEACAGTPDDFNSWEESAQGADSVCRTGHTGPLCSVCTTGYSKLNGELCEVCEGSDILPLLASGGMFAAAMLGAYAIYIAMKKFKAYRDSKMSKLDAKEADRAKYREEELKRMYWVCVMKGKIIVTFFQIVCSFGGIFTVPYPEVFTKFLGYFNILNLGILNFFSTGCLLERDYYNDLAVVTLVPLIITVTMAIMYRVQTRRALSLEEKQRNKKRYISYFLMLLFFIYTGVTSAIFQVFQVSGLQGHKH